MLERELISFTEFKNFIHRIKKDERFLEEPKKVKEEIASFF